MTWRNLDARLAAAASLVRPNARCADIGTDHGYLIGALAASGKIARGCACDLKEKPLQKARAYLESLRLELPVEVCLGDGLSCLSPGDWDDFVIAGMGGDLIWRILNAVPWTRDPCLRFILCPMTKPERLRRALYENGFVLLRETPVLCGGFPYSVMQAAYTGLCSLPGALFCFGGLLLSDPSPEAAAYLYKAACLVRKRLHGLESANVPQNKEIEEHRQMLNGLLERLPDKAEGWDAVPDGYQKPSGA